MNARLLSLVVICYSCIHPGILSELVAADASEIKPRALKFEYEVKREEIEKPLSELKTLYRSQLDKLLVKVQSAGELNQTIAVKAAQSILAGEATVSSPSDFEDLVRLRGIYEKEKAKRTLHVQQNLVPLLTAYERDLNSAKISLTKKGLFDEAKIVAARQDAIIDELASLETSIKKLKSGSAVVESGPVKLPASVSKGLQLYYNFDEKPQGGIVRDASPKGRHAKIEGSATWSTSGKKGGSFTFDGQSGRLQITQALPDMKSMTVATWVHYRAPTGRAGMIFCDFDGKSGNDVMFGLIDRSNAYIRADKGRGNDLRGSVKLRKELTDGWHHILWALSPSRSTIYIDGERAGSISKSGSNIGFHNAYIGYGHDERGWAWFKGNIDEFMIWDRYLTATEARDLFLSTR